jgi:transporter family protein
MSPAAYILIAALAWGCWGICDKLAVRTMHPAMVQLINVMFGVFLAPVYWAFYRSSGTTSALTMRGGLWSLAGAFTTGVASLAYIYALRERPAGTVVALTSAYPLVTIVLAVLMLGERITLEKMIGVGLILLGVFVVSR